MSYCDYKAVEFYSAIYESDMILEVLTNPPCFSTGQCPLLYLSYSIFFQLLIYKDNHIKQIIAWMLYFFRLSYQGDKAFCSH
jgi:hypothetical protein